MTRTPKLDAALASAAAAALAWAAWDSSNFTMEGRKWQPAPSGHVAGKDNSPAGLDGDHHPGDDCGICHAPRSTAPDVIYEPAASSRVFTMTGTLMDGRAARAPIAAGEILLQDYAGNVVSMTVNDLGNAWTDAPLAPDPRVADPTEAARWRYKAWVRADGGSRPMMTIPAVGGMSVGRMSCNMHHVATGTLGGLWASPRGTLRSYPALGLGFRKHVYPILRSKCGPCHLPGPSSASQAGETFDYGAGLDLMHLDGSSVTLHDSTGGSTTYVKAGVRAVISTANPEASLLLQKCLEGSTHGGGAFWTVQSPDYQAIRQWIAEGANDN
jgi:hypothetical protein